MVRGKAKNYLKLKIVFLKSLYQKLNENALSKSNFPKEKIESPQYSLISNSQILGFHIFISSIVVSQFDFIKKPFLEFEELKSASIKYFVTKRAIYLVERVWQDTDFKH